MSKSGPEGGCCRGAEGRTDVDALMGKARRYSRALFFGFEKEHGKLLDSRHRDISSVVSSQEGLGNCGQPRLRTDMG